MITRAQMQIHRSMSNSPDNAGLSQLGWIIRPHSERNCSTVLSTIPYCLLKVALGNANDIIRLNPC